MTGAELSFCNLIPPPGRRSSSVAEDRLIASLLPVASFLPCTWIFVAVGLLLLAGFAAVFLSRPPEPRGTLTFLH